MGFLPFAAVNALALQAATAAAGAALTDDTPVLLSWTAPDDGQLHRFAALAALAVTDDAAGGQADLTWTSPDGTAQDEQVFAADLTTGSYPLDTGYALQLIAPGTTVSWVQSSALTGGAAALYAEIWGS
jgi:hypothetical protein